MFDTKLRHKVILISIALVNHFTKFSAISLFINYSIASFFFFPFFLTLIFNYELKNIINEK